MPVIMPIYTLDMESRIARSIIMLIFMCVLEAAQSIDHILFEEDIELRNLYPTHFHLHTTYTPNICIVFVM